MYQQLFYNGHIQDKKNGSLLFAIFLVYCSIPHYNAYHSQSGDFTPNYTR